MSSGSLREREPHLSEFLDAEVERIAGQMALSGAPSQAVTEVCSAFRILCARALYALDTGHRLAWKQEILAPLTHTERPEEGGIA